MQFQLTALVCAAVTLRGILAYSLTTHSRDVDRRAFVISSASLFGVPAAAKAARGESAGIELPNYIEYLIEKNQGPPEGESLYTGADPKVLLERLLVANTKLSEIPALAQEKKWSQIQGVLSGPMGSLAETLNLIIKSSPESQAAGKQVKNDLIAIGQAASKKDGAKCAAGAAQASRDLEAFVKVAFQ